MKNLTVTELVAIVFAGLAGVASAVQAYVSWETRGEVSRAIVFAQRIDACSRVMAAIEPLLDKARADGRAIVAKGQPGGRYSLNRYYYKLPSGNAAFRAKHDPQVEKWRVASAALQIVAPTEGMEERITYFNRAITKDIVAGKFMSQAELLTWLETFESSAKTLKQNCRSLM